VHTPAWQASPVVHELPSSQEVPFGFVGFAGQLPPEQVACVWHWSAAGQLVTVPPVQAPLWQVSPEVQALPSLQVPPINGCVQAPALVHASVAHWLPSSLQAALQQKPPAHWPAAPLAKRHSVLFVQLEPGPLS
jgi:hypothetical protein